MIYKSEAYTSIFAFCGWQSVPSECSNFHSESIHPPGFCALLGLFMLKLS